MKNTLLILTLFAATTAVAQTRDEFDRFLEKSPLTPLPYITRTIEESKISNSWSGTELEGRDTVFYSQPEDLSRDLWTVYPHLTARFKIGDVDMLLFSLWALSESGADFTGVELCTYDKNGIIIDRVWCGSGAYDEFRYSFYESAIAPDGVIKVLEEYGEDNDFDGTDYDVRRTLRTYKLEQDGTLSLLSEEEVENEYSLTTVVALNDSVSVRLREITREEYDVRRTAAAHLQPEPYKVVTDIAEAKRMLGGRLKVLDRPTPALDTVVVYHDYEITFKDGKKKSLDFEDYSFMAYFPELEILLFEGGHQTDQPFDLNDSRREVSFTEGYPHHIRIGNPYYHSVSPGGRWRINGFFDGQDIIMRFLEEWNPAEKKYEFSGFFFDRDTGEFWWTKEWFWSDENSAIFDANNGRFYEMTIIENTPAQ